MTALDDWQLLDPGAAVDARALDLERRVVAATALSALPPPRPIVEGLVYRDSLAWFYGKPGHGKSFVLLDVAASVAAGIPWHGRAVEQGGVLYIAGEGVAGMGKRVDAWQSWHRTDASRLLVLPVAVQLGRPVDVDALTQVLRYQQPALSLIVIDTQARTSVGLDENSARDMGVYVESLERIRAATGACVAVAHHIGRSGDTPRGSTAVDGAATTMIRVEKDGPRITVAVAKQRDSEPAAPLRFRLTPHAGSAVPYHQSDVDHCQNVCQDQEPTPAEQSILAAIEAVSGSNGASPSPVFAAAEVTDRTGYRLLSSLVSRGLVIKDATGRRSLYRLPAPIAATTANPLP